MGCCSSKDATPQSNLPDGGKVEEAAELSREGVVEQKVSEEESLEGVAVRKEIRAMSKAEQQRFLAGLKKMMESKDGVPQTSEYFRLAGYHGWPSSYCSHRQETFPSWHRAYLVEFEKALQEADLALGYDGQIGLPYWDWTDISGDEVFPSIFREEFDQSQPFPEDFFDPDDSGAQQLKSVGFTSVRDDDEIRERLLAARVNTMVQEALRAPEHWKHASTRWGFGTSLERPHDQIHVAIGFPMSSVEFAAFHPIFFLHHCNVDRLYERYLRTEPDSQAEFEATQAILAERGEPDRFQQPLEPFSLPEEDGGGRPFMPADAFKASALGYRYDALPLVPVQQLRVSPPVLAVFKGVDVAMLDGESYVAHVFLLRPGEDAAGWARPEGPPRSFAAEESYAGSAAVFGGKGSECRNCRESGPVQVIVDISNAVTSAGISRHDARLVVLVEDMLGQVRALEDSPLPEPVITGPFFEDMTAPLGPAGEGGEEPAPGAVQQVQRYLSKFGYFLGAPDGVFGEELSAALTKFQRFAGLPETGVVDAATKAKIMKRRVDSVEDKVDEDDKANWTRGETLKYWVGTCPGYLNRAGVLAAIEEAFTKWSNALSGGLTFEAAEARDGSDIVISWGDRSDDNLFVFDGPGGALAHAGKNYISLDSADRWQLVGQPARVGSFYLDRVILHEIGHVLGLSHSNSHDDAMAPFYNAGHANLTRADIERVTALYTPGG